jgi:hypothetical protein
MIEVLDNFVDKDYADYIEKEMLERDFKWYISRSYFTCPEWQTKKYSHMKNLKEYLLLSHDLYNEDKKVSDKTDIVDNIVNRLPKRISIYRAKANLQTQSTDNNEVYHNTPHIDLYNKNGDYQPHKVALYYVNDSDGDTILFNDKLDIVRRVKPKKGRILLFNGDTLHTSSHPTKSDYRMCINIDYHD